MKNAILYTFAAVLALTGTAAADVKIKVKQTMSGQTSENTTYIKGKRTRTEMMDGAAISVSQCDIGRDLQLFPQTKTYTITTYDGTPAASGESQNQSGAVAKKGGVMYVTTTIRDTGERKQMFGYTARHIVQTIQTEAGPESCFPTKSKMEIDAWVIDGEFGTACTQSRTYRPYNSGRSTGCIDKVVPKTVGSAKSGYPLWQKMTSFDADGKESFSMVQEVVEMSKATLADSLFEAPADYRQVKDASEAYAVQNVSSSQTALPTYSASSGTSSGVARESSSTAETTAPIGPKTAGVIRLGLAAVKTGAVGEGISAADLSAAIGNSLRDFLKGSRVEVVTLDARLASAQAGEAKQKECDFVIVATASHKKGGGGGFGFGKMLGQVVGQTGIGATGSVVGNIAGQVATTAIVSAGNLSGNVKSKDELTLDLRLVSVTDNSSPLTRQFKMKARSDGDDIISAVVEQAAQAIVDALGK
jgi:hypothetical protein